MGYPTPRESWNYKPAQPLLKSTRWVIPGSRLLSNLSAARQLSTSKYIPPSATWQSGSPPGSSPFVHRFSADELARGFNSEIVRELAIVLAVVDNKIGVFTRFEGSGFCRRVSDYAQH